MGLRVDESDRETWYDGWPLPKRPHFVPSKAFEEVCHELERYIHGQVEGRSLLISGHRGIGKTTLVRWAVDHVGRAAIGRLNEQARKAKQAKEGDRASSNLERPQRPLLVRLHGPSLLADIPVEEKAAGADGEGAGSDAKKDAAPSTSDNALARQALIQMTLALYRSLAAEVSHGFAAHARDLQKSRPPAARHDDFMELAAQLTLELDRGPDPATLRAFWYRLKRLDSGILWPAVVGGQFDDQGMREVLAVATAAQAYRICIGSVSDKENGKSSRSTEKTTESKGELALKDLVNALGAPLVGGLVGVFAYAQLGTPVAALAAGVGSSLLSALTLSWSAKRSARLEHASEYNFIRRTDTQTLGRDLPQIIERIRMAGLSPIFVIDELDKVDKCDEKISTILGNLKHIIADNGFFIFITDHNYFRKIHRISENGNYPVSYTYFGNRFYVRYKAVDAYGYLRKILVSDAGSNGSDGAQSPQNTAGLTSEDLFTRSVLSSVILHRSRLNMVKFHRQIVERCNGEGKVSGISNETRNPLTYKIPVSIQLAIEYILNDEYLSLQADRDAVFAQILTDALYFPSRMWEDGEEEIDLGEASLAKYLWKSFADEESPGQEPSGAGLEERNFVKVLIDRIGAVKWGLLVEAVNRLSELLLDTQKLREKLVGPATGAHGGTVASWPADVLAGMSRPLLERVSGEEDTYRFVYDPLGRERNTASSRTSRTGRRRDELTKLLRFARNFMEILKLWDVTPVQLEHIEVLPPISGAGEINRICDDLERKLTDAVEDLGSDDDIEALRQFVNVVIESSEKITYVLCLVKRIAYEVNRPVGSLFKDYLKVIVPYLMSDRIEGFPGALLPPDRKADIGSSEAWEKGLTEYFSGFGSSHGARDIGEISQTVWSHWKHRIDQHLQSPTYRIDKILYEECVLLAVDRAPSEIFRFDFQNMSAHEWSIIAGQAFMFLDGYSSEADFPLWCLLVSLGFLGFGERVLSAALDLEWRSGIRPEPEDRALSTRLSRNTATVQRGLLLRMRDTNSVGDRAWQPQAMPVVALNPNEIDEYRAFLLWLTELNAIQGESDEE